jgi:hypothetical protein
MYISALYVFNSHKRVEIQKCEGKKENEIFRYSIHVSGKEMEGQKTAFNCFKNLECLNLLNIN